MRFDAEDESAAVAERVRRDLGAVLAALAERPGFVTGRIGRSPDLPSQWVVSCFWVDAGSLRRGLSAYEVKLALGPVTALAVDQTGVFESAPGQASSQGWSDRSDEAESSGPQRS